MNIRDNHGNLPIVGGYISDDRPPEKIILIDNDGVDVTMSGHKPTGVFIE
jgi:hypothetical protein